MEEDGNQKSWRKNVFIGIKEKTAEEKKQYRFNRTRRNYGKPDENTK